MRRIAFVLLGVVVVGSVMAAGVRAADAAKGGGAVQRMVYVRADGTTFFFEGDPLKDKAMPRLDRQALPYLLEKGWRIVSVHMVPEPHKTPDAILALIVLTKP